MPYLQVWEQVKVQKFRYETEAHLGVGVWKFGQVSLLGK